MPEWHDPRTDKWYEYEPPQLEVDLPEDDNGPILYGPDGEPIGRVTNRVPFGFHGTKEA